MTHRERWLNTLHFKPVDHVPDEEFGYWDETFTTWHPQGLPLEINNNGAVLPELVDAAIVLFRFEKR